MITKNYIKMCEEAKQIQKAWNPKQFDCYYGKDMKHTFILGESSLINIIEKFKKRYIWLPTREQLQEILQKGREWVYYGSYPLSEFCGWILTSGGPNEFYHHQYKSLFKSINELWLAFLMYELYNKIWTGSEWVTAE